MTRIIVSGDELIVANVAFKRIDLREPGRGARRYFISDSGPVVFLVSQKMKIRHLLASTDLQAFRDIRIESTRDAPESFRATEEEMRAKPIETFRSQLTPCEGGPVFIGAFEGDVLVGVAGLFFEESSKLSHKATLGAVFVTPGHRRKGIGRRLISEMIRIARDDKKLKQLNLSVSTTNKTAVKLYEELGFSVFGTEPNAAFVNGKGYDEHHMQCVL